MEFQHFIIVSFHITLNNWNFVGCSSLVYLFRMNMNLVTVISLWSDFNKRSIFRKRANWKEALNRGKFCFWSEFETVRRLFETWCMLEGTWHLFFSVKWVLTFVELLCRSFYCRWLLSIHKVDSVPRQDLTIWYNTLV